MGTAPSPRALASALCAEVSPMRRVLTIVIAALIVTSLFAPIAASGDIDDDVGFSGGISLEGNEATSTTQYQYDVNDMDSVDDFEVELEGYEETEDRSESTITDDGTLEVEPRGTSDPQDAEVTLEGIEDETEVSDTFDGVSDGYSDEIEIEGSTAPVESGITFEGLAESDSQELTGNVADGSTQDIDVNGNLEPSDPEITIDGAEEEREQFSSDISMRANMDPGDFDSDTFEIDTLDEVHNLYIEIENTHDDRFGETEFIYDGETIGKISAESGSVEEGSFDVKDLDIPVGEDIEIEATPSDDDESGTIDVNHIEFQSEPTDDVEVSSDDGESVAFGSGGTESFDITRDTSEISFDWSGSNFDYEIAWADSWGTKNPSVELDGSQGSQTVDIDGVLEDGETATRDVDLETGSYDLEVASDGYETDIEAHWTERNESVDPTVDIAGETIAHNGLLEDGETVTESIDLETGESYEGDIWSDGPVKASVGWTDISETIDPGLEVNGNTATHGGVLEDGETTSLDVDEDWIQEGENRVNVTMADPNGGPDPLVDFDYSHDASGVSTAAEAVSETWTESYEVSHQFPSDQTDAEAVIPFDSSRVVDIRDVEVRYDDGDWHTPDYSLESDGPTLAIDLGDVDEGTEVDARANGSKVRVDDGEIDVIDPTIEGDSLESEIEITSHGDDFAIDVSETSEGEWLHYTENESWSAPDTSSVVDASGNQEIRMPDASAGSTTTVTTTELEAQPNAGEVAVSSLDDDDEPTFDVAPDGATEVDYSWHNAESGEDYTLYSETHELARDTATASSPVTLSSPAHEETLTIMADEDRDEGSGSTTGDPPTESGTPILLLITGVGAIGGVAYGASRTRVPTWIAGVASVPVILIALETLAPGTISGGFGSAITMIGEAIGTVLTTLGSSIGTVWEEVGAPVTVIAVGVGSYIAIRWWRTREERADTPESEVTFELGDE